METTMFTLGVLSIILAALVATVVYGIVTVLKLKTDIQWKKYNTLELTKVITMMLNWKKKL